ncbi:MAG TPA: O-antigen ligase family protein [Gaiellaceae bacterium]
MTRPLTITDERVRPSPAAVVLAAAIPVIFLHTRYQPELGVPLGGTTANVFLTDIAIGVVAVAAAAEGWRDRARVRFGLRWLWLPLVAFLALLLASCFYAHAISSSYGVGPHLVSALKFCGYALLAPAAAIVLRDASNRRLVFWAVAAWSIVLSAVAVLQFVGVLDEFRGRRPQGREPSWIGIHDLGAFSGAAISFAFATIVLALRERRRLQVVGAASGAVGLSIAAAFDSLGGMALTAAATWALARRRGTATLRAAVKLGALVAAVALATTLLRASALHALFEFVGVAPASEQVEKDIQTYSHRTVLIYIGARIFLDHPVLGVGWQGSAEEYAYGPYLAAAHRRFDVAEASFPSPRHPWGVQNGVVQTLSDLGLAGFALFVAFFAAALLAAGRVALRGPPELAWSALAAVGWLVFAFAVFTGSGLLPGIPVDALLWLGVGLAAALHVSFGDRS